MSQNTRNMLEFAAFSMIAATTISSDGGERIGMVLSWGLIVLTVAGSLFSSFEDQVSVIVKSRIKKGYGTEPALISFFQLLPLIGVMAYINNMWTAGFLTFVAAYSCGLSADVNEKLEAA